MKKQSILLIIATILLVACGQKKQSNNLKIANDSIEIKYAKGFKIDCFDNYKKITVNNMFEQGKTQQIIYLVDNKEINTPKDGIKIVVPISKIGVGSVTYYGFLMKLDEINSVKGVCSPDITYNEHIRNMYANNEIINLGDGFNPNIEELIVLRPDIFMLPSYHQQEEIIKRLGSMGISFVFNNEWLETTPLGRTEWLKFVAAFYNKSAEADSLFNEIEQRYIAAKQLVTDIEEKPSILLNTSFKGTWYMPGGQSYVASLIKDANGSYFYENDTTNGSLALSFEVILKNFTNADIWLNVSANSLPELLAMDQRHSLFKPTRNGKVFSFMSRYLPSSANDYWETALVEPDIVLKDIIWALYPNIMQGYQPKYIKNIAK